MQLRLVPAALAAASLLTLASAAAAISWKPYASASDGFRAKFPGTPTVTSQASSVAVGGAYRTYSVNYSDAAYIVAAFRFTPGSAPAASDATYRGFLDAYANGTGCTVKSTRALKIAGVPALEAVCITAKTRLDSLADLVLSDDTLYQIVSAGTPGHSKRREAQTFRNSFAFVPTATPSASPTPAS